MTSNKIFYQLSLRKYKIKTYLSFLSLVLNKVNFTERNLLQVSEHQQTSLDNKHGQIEEPRQVKYFTRRHKLLYWGILIGQ